MGSKERTVEIELAPMHGVTDFVFRFWFYLLSGCEKMTTPFLRVTESYPHKIPESWAPDLFSPEIKARLGFETRLQMMASCPERFVLAYKMFENYVDEVELNCGCPSPKVVSHAAGSSLLREVSVFRDFVSYIVQEIPTRNLSVKIRTGYENTEKFTDLVKAISSLDLKRLSIHGRTKEQKYNGFSRMDLIHEGSLLCPYPVFASGDVVDKESYERALKAMPRVHGILIGRGALKNPFLFSELKGTFIFKGEDYFFLFYALKVYGVLMEAMKTDYEKFKGFLLENSFAEPIFDHPSKWRELLEALYQSFYGKSYQESLAPELSVSTLGRLKLMWANYLQGFCSHIKGRAVLRMKTSEEFFKALEDLLASQ